MVPHDCRLFPFLFVICILVPTVNFYVTTHVCFCFLFFISVLISYFNTFNYIPHVSDSLVCKILVYICFYLFVYVILTMDTSPPYVLYPTSFLSSLLFLVYLVKFCKELFNHYVVCKCVCTCVYYVCSCIYTYKC